LLASHEKAGSFLAHPAITPASADVTAALDLNKRSDASASSVVRRYFFDARLNDPERAHEALARIRALYAVEQTAKEKGRTGSALAASRQQHAAPVLTAFAGWLADQRPRVLPKSSIGEAFKYATNQWPTLGVYLTDGRLAIDNAAAEQAIRPLAVGRRNWLHLGGDGGLKPTAVLLSISASIKRQGLDQWAYLTHVLSELPRRPVGAGLDDLLPDEWAKSRGDTRHLAG
jgi:hypothetical protein